MNLMMCRTWLFLVLVVFGLWGRVVISEEPELHWAFRKMVRPEPPARESLREAVRVRNPIDQFVLNRLEKAKLEPAVEASRATLIRRAYFDLIGLPPTAKEVQAFVADDSPEAWSELINTLLESKHYGERWARHWLDVARYADSGGYETDIYYRNAWRYRDYVVNSFNADKPFNGFVQEQIAGDELWPDDLDLDPRNVYVPSDEKKRHLQARIATGFYSLGPRVHESGLDGKRLAYETMTDWVDSTASAFMGLTLGCSRCHDHKLDPFTQHDYFSLQAIFATARETEIHLWTSMEEADWRQHFPRVVAAQEAVNSYRQFKVRNKIEEGTQLTPEQQSEAEKLLETIGKAVVALPEFSPGQGGIKYAELMQIPAANVLERKHPALIKPVHVLARGELSKPLAEMQPALPALLAEVTGTSAELPQLFESRKQLALWLTQPEHPLTARVIVNRVWQWHFSRGIVETSNDFGRAGQVPSHPELLDWLATKFVADGWLIKDLHRLIMNSATYRQSSYHVTDRHLDSDPDNRLLWRMNRRRLEGEVLWDAVHAAAGTLNLAMGGPPVIPPLSADEIASLRNKWHWVVSADPAQHTRRGLYILVRRNFKFPMFEVFDAPVNSVSCPVRDITTVAPQALWGLNNPSVFRQATHFAGRIVSEAGERPESQIDRAWWIALGRKPKREEADSAMRLLEQLEEENVKPVKDLPETLHSLPPARASALSKLCLALFNLSEFAYID